MSWSARLVKPIVPANGKPIVTLSDARSYILTLPKLDQESEIVQATAEAILMAAEDRGPILTAQAGVAQIVHGPIKMVSTGKKSHWGRTKRA